MARDTAEKKEAARRVAERGRDREPYEEGRPTNFGYNYKTTPINSRPGRPGLESQRFSAILHAAGDPKVRAVGGDAPKSGQGITWGHVPEEVVDRYEKNMRWLQGEDVQSRPGGHRRYGWDKGERRFEPRRFEYTIPERTPLAAEYMYNERFPQLPPEAKIIIDSTTPELQPIRPSWTARPPREAPRPKPYRVPLPGLGAPAGSKGDVPANPVADAVTNTGRILKMPFEGLQQLSNRTMNVGADILRMLSGPPMWEMVGDGQPGWREQEQKVQKSASGESTTQALWRDLIRELIHGPGKPEDSE